MSQSRSGSAWKAEMMAPGTSPVRSWSSETANSSNVQLGQFSSNAAAAPLRCETRTAKSGMLTISTFAVPPDRTITLFACTLPAA